MRVLVVIPALNEEESLPVTLDEVLARDPRVDVLVVDDGSRDAHLRGGARARASRWCAIRSTSAWARRSRPASASRSSTATTIGVQLDADGQHDPRRPRRRWSRRCSQGACDVTIGSRYVTRSGYRAPLARRLGMMLFSGVVRLAVRTADRRHHVRVPRLRAGGHGGLPARLSQGLSRTRRCSSRSRAAGSGCSRCR